jgi:uncharacterized protein with HEPN domain
MREPERDAGRLADIFNAANNLAEFTYGITLEAFLTDKLRYYAVLKNIEIIGEAAYMLSVEYKESRPEIPWKSIINMRHVLVHGYASILPELLWETATHDVPELIIMLREDNVSEA